MAQNLGETMAVLERTPTALRGLLDGLPEVWVRADEGPDTWSAYTIVGHLLHGDRTDWLPRVRKILDHGESAAFEPFDRFAQLREPQDRPLDDLLVEFADVRAENLRGLATLRLTPADFTRTGTHPVFGRVTLDQLLSTWAVHDLGHLAQICRVMAGRYRDAIGPWSAFLPIVGPGR